MKKFFILSFSALTFSFANAQEPIHLYEDTVQMRNELLLHIPVGTDTVTAKSTLEKSKFEYYGRYIDSEFLRTSHINYLFFFLEKGEIWSSIKWQVAVIYDKEGKVADVLVVFHVIQL